MYNNNLDFVLRFVLELLFLNQVTPNYTNDQNWMDRIDEENYVSLYITIVLQPEYKIVYTFIIHSLYIIFNICNKKGLFKIIYLYISTLNPVWHFK